MAEDAENLEHLFFASFLRPPSQISQISNLTVQNKAQNESTSNLLEERLRYIALRDNHSFTHKQAFTNIHQHREIESAKK